MGGGGERGPKKCRDNRVSRMREQRKSSEIWIWRKEDDRKVLIPVRKLINRFLIATEGATGMESESRRYHISGGFFAFVRLLLSQLEWNQGKIHLTLKNVHFTFPLKLLWIHFWQDIRKYIDDITYDIFNMYCTIGLQCFYKMALVIVKSWVRSLKWSDLSKLHNISHQDLYSN